MDNVKRLKQDRTQSKLIIDFNIAKYRKQTFGIFSGKLESITLQFKGELIDVIFDKFGEQTKILKLSEDSYEIKVKIIPSERFFGTLLGLGTRVKQ